jgi:mRNA interferase MazF
MATILRGEIWWAELDPVRGHEQGGTRPVLIISDQAFNTRSGTVIVMAITSQEPKAGFPLTYNLGEENLPKHAWVKISQIRTLSVQRLTSKLSEIDREIVDEIISGLQQIVG